ncbi:MAG: hypothetical protein WBW94_01395 [Anaerolineales bacterium]
MKSQKAILMLIDFFEKIKRPAFILIFIILHYFAFRNLYVLSEDMILGNFAAQKIVPIPIYGIERIPAGKKVAIKYHAQNRLGVDFAQIYFPAQQPNLLGNSYNENTTLDPAQRPSRYAPLVEYICAMTICKLDFGYASFWHMVIQILLFFLVSYLAFRSLGFKHYFWIFVLFADCCMFLTPVGVTWFQLGQFSLYVAAGYLLLLWGLLRKNIVLILLSALFAFVKWTSLPFSFVALSVYILNSKNRKELQFSLLAAFLFGAVFVLLSLPFFYESIPFIQGLLYQESHKIPQGLSLAIYLPKYIVKSLPFVLSIVGYFIARFNKNDFIDLFPFLIGSSIVLLLYPTLAFDYSAPIMLGLIPLIIFWFRAHQENLSSIRIGQALVCIFLLFIVIASFSTSLIGSVFIVIMMYLVFSIALMAIPTIFMKRAKKTMQ